jgi:hypothetical protein
MQSLQNLGQLFRRTKVSQNITAKHLRVGCYKFQQLNRQKIQDNIVIFTAGCTVQAILLALLLQG